MRPLPLLLAAALSSGVASPALAQAFTVERTRQRAFTTYTFSGPLPAKAKAAKRVFLARGQARHPLLLTLAGGRARARLRTAKLLTPGSYRLAFVAGETTVEVPVALGTPAEAAAASARYDAWYRAALGTFRDLCSSLERRGEFHAALGSAKTGHLKAFQQDFLERSWSPALVGARMDLSIFARRLLLPPRPELLAALRNLAQVLTARRDAWRACVVDRAGKAPPKPGPFTAAVDRALKAAGALSPSPKPAWGPGPLAKVPALPTPGSTHQGLGFSLAIPAKAKVDATSNPVDRLRFSLAGTVVLVQVRELPDDATPTALIRRLELGAWESWESYKRLASTPLPQGAGLVMEFQARLRNLQTKTTTTARIHQRTLFPPGGRRTLTLLFLRPATEQPLSAALLAVEKSFKVSP